LFGGRVIGKSAGDGSFAARSVDPRWSLRAEASGYAPSSLVDLEVGEHAAGATSLRIELHLLHRGGCVAGKVVDELGHGLAGAIVAIGKGGSMHKEGAVTRESFDAAVAVTDESGGFRCDSLTPGLLPIAVRANGHADMLSEVTCTVGTTEEVTLVLTRGVGVHGCVRDEQGALVVGAVIRVVAAADDGTSIDSLSRRPVATLRPPETRSDAAGCYRLQLLPPGTLHLLAAGRGKGVQFQGTCRATMAVRGGDDVTWDPLLVVGKTIRVEVVDEQGNPEFVGAPVIAISEQRSDRGDQLLGLPDRASKVCVFKDCADVPYTVAVCVHLMDDVRKWIYQTGVRPGDPLVRLVVPGKPKTPPQPPGSVSGGLVDAGHRLDGRSVKLSLCSRGTRRDLELSKGRFHIEDVEPGRYFVWVMADEDPVAKGPWFELHSGQDLDVGDVVTEPGVTVRVAVRVPTGGNLGAPKAFLGEGFNHRAMRWDGEHLVAANITPGRYRLRLHTKGWHAPPRDVDVVAGRDTLLSIDAAPALERQLEFKFPMPEQWQQCDFVLRDREGTMVAEIPGYASESIGPFPYVWKGDLPIGQFTLEATLDGKVNKWPVDLRESVPSEQVLRFSLRPR